MKRTIARIVIVGTMMAMSFYLGVGHAGKIENRAEKIIEVIPDGYINAKSEEFLNNYIDLRRVISWNAIDNGLQLYFADGTGYYLE